MKTQGMVLAPSPTLGGILRVGLARSYSFVWCGSQCTWTVARCKQVGGRLETHICGVQTVHLWTSVYALAKHWVERAVGKQQSHRHEN